MSKKHRKNVSSLKNHKRNKKDLIPPLLTNGLNINTTSWLDERLPEMLWAVLVIGNIERDKALNFFRYIAKFVQNCKECSNITVTGISKLPDSKRKAMIRHITNYSEGINKILCTLLLFPELPSYDDWGKYLPARKPDIDWSKLGEAVSKASWHQSLEATDCRWIRVVCALLGGKLAFVETEKETIRGIIEYPNYGDLRSVRPSIRAIEINLSIFEENKESQWAKYFWKYCFENTQCVPEEAVNKKLQERKKGLSEEIRDARNHYLVETAKLRKALIDHYFETSNTSAIDSRHEGAFGFTLYALSLFIETIFYRTSLSITGRLILRVLVEIYITFTYLLKKESPEAKIWDGYRSYGTGQAKLIYLKLLEIQKKVSAIELDELDLIANEDKFVEFTPINLGHWDSTDLRKMSREVGLKEIYDKFYNYTSGFMHGNWGAVRESIYQKCVNPLHRFHRIPTPGLPLMKSSTLDAISIMNKILECLSNAYPKFEERITNIEKKERNEKKR